ncbi:hypothetical protein NEHOM01_0414 [Nematocida homosporus]|uniref:uncharacterized protein n=1 Tax=Nematocida homosporus TaxID=1912981 RepID=UPI00221EDA91|nr:uncharacterized protein NEHOM01_0414 [Nematocida homosporus]KAI5184812.1 hypothetical protein NEHOM01_0414 [Nematocida homosporus]
MQTNDQISSEEEYSLEESGDVGSSFEEETSMEELSSSEGSEDPQIFTVHTGECSGTFERVDLILENEMPMVNRAALEEEVREKIFKGIFVWADAESTEDEPWITAFFAMVPYVDLAGAMFAGVQREVERLGKKERIKLLINGRFKNVPDDVVCEMYTALPNCLELDEKERVLLLSLEKPINPKEEKEIKKVFPTLNLAKMKNLFPIHSEEVFLYLSNLPAAFTTHGDGSIIKGYLLDKKGLSKFISALREYLEAE